jgi:hypothetical protein
MSDQKANKTPDGDSQGDTEGSNAVAALAAQIANALSGIAQGQSTAVTGSEATHKMQTDINTEEALSAFTGLAVAEATGHQSRLNKMAEQVLQNAITQANMISNNTINHVHKRTIDQDTNANMLNMQALRNTDVATDRIWNIDEQIAAAEVLYAALGRYLSSTSVEKPA